MRNNRRLVEEMRTGIVSQNFNSIKRENPLQIGHAKIQLILDEHQIDTVEKLEIAMSSNLITAPLYKKVVKNFLETKRKEELVEIKKQVEERLEKQRDTGTIQETEESDN